MIWDMQHTTILALVLLGGSLSLASCDFQNEGPFAAPTITAVSPTGVIGKANATVIFSATATEAPTSWEWDFDGATHPRTSADPSPGMILAKPGSYTGRVKACNVMGCSEPFSFNFTIAPSDQAPVVQSVLPAGIAGVSGQRVTFTVTLDRAADGIGWDFGGGAIPNVSAGDATEVTLGAPGTYTGTVEACIIGLAACSLPTTFTYQILPAP